MVNLGAIGHGEQPEEDPEEIEAETKLESDEQGARKNLTAGVAYFKQKKIFARIGFGTINLSEKYRDSADDNHYGTNHGSLPLRLSVDIVGLSVFNNTCGAAWNTTSLIYGKVYDDGGSNSEKSLRTTGVVFDCGLKFISSHSMKKLRFGAGFHRANFEVNHQSGENETIDLKVQSFKGYASSFLVAYDYYPWRGPINLSVEAAMWGFDFNRMDSGVSDHEEIDGPTLQGYSVSAALGVAL